MPKIITKKSNVDLDYPICRPSLDLDFTQEVLDERITFSRGSIGTRVNRNRLIETVSANTPRFDYDPVTGECKGLLIEESRQNIVLNSTTLSSHTNSATTDNVTTETVSPDGTSNAYKVIGNSGVRTRQSIYSNSFTMNANSSYTASVFLKGTATRRYVVMWFDNTAPGNAPVEGPYYGSNVFIDLLTGTSTNSSIVKMVPYVNGWYRCFITATVGASNLINVFFNVSIGSPNGFNDVGNPNQYKYVGDGLSGIYYWGPQVEVGAFPTTYIPTAASTVTRSAELANMTGTNFSSWYNPSEGTIYVNVVNRQIYGSSIAFPYLYQFDDGTGNNIIAFDYSVGASSFRNFSFSSINGITSLVLNRGFVYGNSVKSISAFATNNSTLYDSLGGTTTDKSGTLPTGLNRLRIGNGNGGPFTGTISRFTYYPRALKPNQLQLLTQ